MGDVVIDAVRTRLRELRAQAAARRRVSTLDPVSDAIDYCVAVISEELATLERGELRVTVDEYARVHGVTQQTVRTWCRKSLLAAVATPKGWMIPKDAVRVRWQRKLPRER
jgi:hypothetical protein